MQQKPDQRVVYLDLLRVVATFGVIALHAFSYGFHSQTFCMTWYYSMVFDALVRWSVPVFFMISGALFLDPNKNITTKSILTKSIPRLLVAYFAWVLIYCFIDGSFSFSLSDLRNSNCYFHLWFLPNIMAVYLFVPILRRIVIDARLLHYSLMIWMCWIFIKTFSSFLLPQFISLFSDDFGVYVGYFLLGYFLSQVSMSPKQNRVILLLGVIAAIVTIIGTIVMSWGGNSSEFFFDYARPNVAVMAISVFLAIKGKAINYEHQVLRLLEYVRKDLV